MLCPVCAIPGAPTPSGIETRTVDGTVHRTRECASLAAARETPIRTKDGYKAKSGRIACDPCFYLGHPHSYTADDEPHAPEVLAAQSSRIQLLEQQRMIGVDETVKLLIDKWLADSTGTKPRREPSTASERRARAREKARQARQRRQAQESEKEQEQSDGTARTSAQERTASRAPTETTD